MASPCKSESAVKGLRVEIFARKYYPSLDGTERHTALAEGKATRLSLLPHGECGVWGNAPQLKFRDGVRPPFSKGVEDWGCATCFGMTEQIGRGQSPLSALCKSPELDALRQVIRGYILTR